MEENERSGIQTYLAAILQITDRLDRAFGATSGDHSATGPNDLRIEDQERLVQAVAEAQAELQVLQVPDVLGEPHAAFGASLDTLHEIQTGLVRALQTSGARGVEGALEAYSKVEKARVQLESALKSIRDAVTRWNEDHPDAG